MWPRRQLGVLVAVLTLLAVGCARFSQSQSSAGAGRAILSPDARLLAAGSNEFVLSGATLYRAQGARLMTVASPLPAAGSAARAVSFDGASGVMATSDGAAVTVFSSSDAGHTWKKTAHESMSQVAPEGVGDLQVALLEGRIVVLAREMTSSNFASAIVLASSGDGAWKTRQAPTAGRLTSGNGLFWLVGGVEGNQVYASEDGSEWTSITLPVNAQSWSAGLPAAVQGLGTMMSVTVHKAGESSRVVLFRSTDHGRTWSAAASVALAAHTEAGTTVPAAISPDGDWFVIEPDGLRVYSGNLAGQASNEPISPNGLPSGVGEAAFFSSTDGMVLVARSSCPSGKDSCRSTEVALRTRDGGQTWEEMTFG